jgi:hypothetical protein
LSTASLDDVMRRFYADKAGKLGADTTFFERAGGYDNSFSIAFVAGNGARNCFGEQVDASDWFSHKVTDAGLHPDVLLALSKLVPGRNTMNPQSVLDRLKAVPVVYNQAAAEHVVGPALNVDSPLAASTAIAM